jgi:hypothetical protein
MSALGARLKTAGVAMGNLDQVCTEVDEVTVTGRVDTREYLDLTTQPKCFPPHRAPTFPVHASKNHCIVKWSLTTDT